MILIKTTLDSFIGMGKHEHNIGSAISTQMAVKQLSYYVATAPLPAFYVILTETS